MTAGLVALHGGGEYAAGDEPAMDALVGAAQQAALVRRGTGAVPRIAVVPTAAARQRPELAGEHGIRAFEAAGQRAGVPLRVEIVPVLDAASAASRSLAARLSGADLVHLPGGDPGIIPAVLAGSAALQAILATHAHGAVVAGASAGAMALAERTWTPEGAVAGLTLVPGIAVLPHFDPERLERWRAEIEDDLTRGRARVRWLGLDDRTLVIGVPGRGGWRVAGPGAARLFAPGATEPAAIARHGETLGEDATPGSV
jgi:cyanophycinase-like exopeptidase